MMKNIERLVEKLAADAVVVRPAPHPFALGLKWMGTAAAYLAVLLALTGLRPDLMEKFGEPWFAAEIALLLGIFVAATLSAALLAFPDLHQKRGAAWTPAAMMALFIAVIFFAWNADDPPSPLPSHSFECTLSIVLVALLPAIWTLHAMRGYASTHYRTAGSIVLLAAFSVGALWLRLHEVNNSVFHMIQWHYLPMLAAGLIGLWVGRLVLKW
jgi:hypothetical protein